ncbi:hypothetical protein T492DRAFT_843597 [Pavlovales sp. CCMP2436]|nr:hypothetical protein T492DRAFT_843597 [Pavlovales sp. CCMP2436]
MAQARGMSSTPSMLQAEQGLSTKEVMELVRTVALLKVRLDKADARIADMTAEANTIRPTLTKGSSVSRGLRPTTPRGGQSSASSEQRTSSQRTSSRPQTARGQSPARRKSPVTRKPPTRFFTASMRGGPMTEPMKATGRTFLTAREREDPESALQGPSLLLRRELTEQGYEMTAVISAIARAREYKRANPEVDTGAHALSILQSNTAPATRHQNVIEDDNPYNDGVKYWPFRGFAFPPSDFKGPGDMRQVDELNAKLELSFVYGYRGDRSRSNLFYTKSGKLVYHTAAVGIVYDQHSHSQAFFHGHDDDIVSLALHPEKD